MPLQLIFTSTPQGLTPGRSGYCTVARHRAVPDRLAQLLESVGTPRIAPAYLAEIERCQNTINDALNLLQQHDGDWSASSRTAWADLLHLDRARLHHHAWKCGGWAFTDPHREQALEALRQMSSSSSADALSLRLELYRGVREGWPIPKIGGDPGNTRTRVAPGQANRREAWIALRGFHHAACRSAAGADNQGDTGIGHNHFLRIG
jgi:hypothetical protein